MLDCGWMCVMDEFHQHDMSGKQIRSVSFLGSYTIAGIYLATSKRLPNSLRSWRHNIFIIPQKRKRNVWSDVLYCFGNRLTHLRFLSNYHSYKYLPTLPLLLSTPVSMSADQPARRPLRAIRHPVRQVKCLQNKPFNKTRWRKRFAKLFP